ncbi:MAG: photosystem II complex extrinsic protein PsbU [Kamptonema sp. SIO4C4]|nr:photosystem II complex extrinsic protein PsbU [Kamptonema sp. SIO4C4]
MKRLAYLLVILVLALGYLGGFTQQPAQAGLLDQGMFSTPFLAETRIRNDADKMLETEFGQKIDLNNANVRAFTKVRGFYPTLAQKIVSNAPYEKVEDVLDIPGLSEKQKERLQANLDKFTAVQSADVFNQGAERLNNGIYD